jgi:predicted AlkP superfamily phosphohydrolase/phosphomutase
MPPAPTKVFVLGIDAANPALLKQWAADGALPNLRALMARGLVGNVRGLDGFFVGSTWPSFYTGVSPARHGFYYQVQLKAGTYDFYRPETEGLVKSDPFWRGLSGAGRRVAILDVPLAPLDPSVNGVQVVEWGSHDAVYGFHTAPASLAETVQSRFGAYPLGTHCDGVRRTADDYSVFIDALVKGVRTKAELTRYFLGQAGWDFFMQVFTESHCAGHQCWHLHDVAHPAHDPAIVAAMGDPLHKIYRAIDAAIGALVNGAGDGLVMVLTAHGMDYWYGAQFLLKEILFRLGVACPPAGARAGRGALARATAAAKWGWRRLPSSVRHRLDPLRERRGGGSPTIGVDPASSYCFPLNNGLAVGGIRLNLMGREPAGIVAPGAPAAAFCQELAENLLAIVDERTNKPLIRRVLLTAELYAGDRLDHLPDLLVEWNDAIPTGSTSIGQGDNAIVRARAPKIGRVEGANHYGRTGEHRPQGLFIAAGPGIRGGVLDRAVSIFDFAPTFGKLLGVDLQDGDGRAIEELIMRR